MGKNDFDIDFDFEKEYGFDPNSFLDTDESGDDIDLSQFTDEELGLTPQDGEDKEVDAAVSGDEPDFSGDFDLDGDLDDFLNFDRDGGNDDAFADEVLNDEPEQEEVPDFADGAWDPSLDFSDDEQPEETDMRNETEYSEEELDDEETEQKKPKHFKPRREPTTVKPKKEAGPNIFTKFYDLYFAPLASGGVIDEPPDPSNPRRRRKKSKAQIFKEVYLPPIIACVCLIFVLSFAIGAVSNVIAQHRIEKEAEKSRLDASESAADEAQVEYQRVMALANEQAAGYNYEEAVKTLDSLLNASEENKTKYPDMVAKRSEYANIQSTLVEHNNPSAIKNLSFHVLLHDPARAYADTGTEGLAKNYNKNFVSTTEFTKILNDLYANGYVLVDFDSFAPINSDQILTQSIFLPEGKKPFMLTETMVNYFAYMIDGNGDGEADANGKGFASKLVLDGNGDIKAEYVDASGTKLVGDYDLVPILESFIKEHPDFSYRGARATLAVCGYEGIFGYRINSSYAATKSTAYQDEQIAGAKAIVQALRDKGYTLACYTYQNENYGKWNSNQIQADLQNWAQQVVPVIGEVNTFVFARESNITDYGTGNSYNVMYNAGFRYFVSNGNEAFTEIKSNYVRQNRLMVTGKTMAYNSSWFNGMFDCAAILDVNLRGTVPQN